MSEEGSGDTKLRSNERGRNPFTEDDLLPLSRLADIEFCERRAALHLIEAVWEDNVFTAEGTVLHERAHDPDASEKRGDLIIARGLWINSFRLGLVGKADIVEFHRTTEDDQSGAKVPGQKGRWRVYPVEYKRGSRKEQRSFQVQLCAQAMCLEEMLGVEVAGGALFYGKTRRRKEVAFDPALREETERLSERLHELVHSGRTPPAVYGPKCDQCSLFNLCHPKTVASGKSAKGYLARSLRSLMRDEPLGELGEVAP